MTTKQKYGQFMTTNYDYILQNMFIPDNITNIIEPFAGNCDLINFIKDINLYLIEYYDIDPKKDYIIKQDTLNSPPLYKNKFILTNPPYLARNKSDYKNIFDKYDVNDLYKCFIKEIIENSPLGGIIIVPLNFWSSIRKNDLLLKKLFLQKFNVSLINIFEENVFDDTTYSVCSFQFSIKTDQKDKININIYPSNKKMQIELNEENDYIIGGDIYKLPLKKYYKIERLTSKNKKDQNTNILVKCLDDNSNKKISMSIVSDKDVFLDNTPNLSARTYASLIIKPSINIEKQKRLVEKFNEYINEQREKYNSLFLTNYRESSDIARKRISFDLVYNITQYILDNLD